MRRSWWLLIAVAVLAGGLIWRLDAKPSPSAPDEIAVIVDQGRALPSRVEVQFGRTYRLTLTGTDRAYALQPESSDQPALSAPHAALHTALLHFDRAGVHNWSAAGGPALEIDVQERPVPPAQAAVIASDEGLHPARLAAPVGGIFQLFGTSLGRSGRVAFEGSRRELSVSPGAVTMLELTATHPGPRRFKLLGAAGWGELRWEGQLGGPETGPFVGYLAPRFALPDLDGRLAALPDGGGPLPAMLVFWASWCGPCRAELPELLAAYQARPAGVHMLLVNVRESRESVDAFLAAQGARTLPAVLDTDGDVAHAYQIKTLPTSLFLSADGRVRARYVGPLTFGLIQRFFMEAGVPADAWSAEEAAPATSEPAASNA